jgi:hypothetical protein
MGHGVVTYTCFPFPSLAIFSPTGIMAQLLHGEVTIILSLDSILRSLKIFYNATSSLLHFENGNIFLNLKSTIYPTTTLAL